MLGLTTLLMLGGLLLSLSGGAPEIASGTSQGEGADKDLGTSEDDETTGTARADLLGGRAGDDDLAGSGGDDWLIGGGGDDLLAGDSGDDVLIGGAGTDTLTGGAGDDFVESAGIEDSVALDASAKDALSISELALSYDYSGGDARGDTVNLGSGDDTVVAGSDDDITTGSGSDLVAAGDWVTPGKPIHITDFDPSDDVIRYSYSAIDTPPEITVQHMAATGQTKVLADGKVIAVVKDSAGTLTADDIHIKEYYDLS